MDNKEIHYEVQLRDGSVLSMLTLDDIERLYKIGLRIEKVLRATRTTLKAANLNQPGPWLEPHSGL